MGFTEIVLDYPWWWFLICLIIAGGLSYLLYTRNYFGEENSLKLRIGLACLRSIFITLLLFLLLGPLLKTNTREIEKPIVILAIDNSSSLRIHQDSTSLNAELDGLKKKFENAVGENKELKIYTFGDKVKESETFDQSEKVSNLSKLFQEIDNRFENRNLGAVLIASDGIFNQGANPEYYPHKLKTPLFTIGLGDTSVQKDLFIKSLRSNDIAYLGNNFPIAVEVEANKLAGNKAKISIEKEGKTLAEKEVTINSETFSYKTEFRLEAKETGTQRYSIRLSNIDGEISYVNNSKDLYINVLDGRNKVQLFASAPHPDIAAIKQAIESNEQYEVEVNYAFQKQFKLNKECNLLILHDLPSLRNTLDFQVQEAMDRKIPLLFILSDDTHLPQFSRYAPGMGVETRRQESNEALPALNLKFDYFQLSEATQSTLKRMPPLTVPYGKYPKLDEGKVLLNQKIGSIETTDPLVAFNETGEQKLGVIYGEGFWRWRLYDFEQNENHEATNEFMSRIVQYLAVKNDRRQFKVKPTQARFEENIRISFEGEYYNDAYQLVNEPDVRLSIYSEEGKEFTYQMGKRNNAYTLDAGYFPPGAYTYKASISGSQGKEYSAKGKFNVSSLQLEEASTMADHRLLERIAVNSGGTFAPIGQSDALLYKLSSQETIQAVSYLRTSYKDLINIKWIFWILLALISAEWIIRKLKSGSV